MPTTPIYKILPLPQTSPQLPALVAKFRSSRLAALQTDPASFVSKYEIEAELPMEVWEKRVNGDTVVLVCVVDDSTSSITPGSSSTSGGDGDDSTTTLLTSPWASSAALRGPMTHESYYASPDMNLPVPENPLLEARWHVFDLYTLPAHRGRGLAARLVRECVSVAVGMTSSFAAVTTTTTSVTPPPPPTHARIRLFMNPSNTWLRKMYENCGFAGVGRVTIEEGFRANGLDESVPADVGSTEALRRVWRTRVGLAMERVVEVG